MLSSQVREGKWESHTPVRKLPKMVFTDCGRAYLAGYVASDLPSWVERDEVRDSECKLSIGVRGRERGVRVHHEKEGGADKRQLTV